jgi:hypothetical protein
VAGGFVSIIEEGAIDANRRSGLVGGLILIMIGAMFLAAQLLPGVRSWYRGEDSWPLIVVGVGVVLLVLAVALRMPPLAVPGCIVAGIGCILFYQNASGNWQSWAYAWALIPGFVGAGVLLTGLMEGRDRSALAPNLWLMLFSLVAFVIFGAFLGPWWFLGLGPLGSYWPILLVLGGLLILGQAIFRRRP